MFNHYSFSSFCQDNKVAKCYHDCNVKNLKSLHPVAESFLEKGFPLMLYGDPGTGKTHFMMTIVRELLDTHRIHRANLKFINAMDLDEKVDAEVKKYGSASYFINNLKDDFFLLIDDFGVEKSRERAERNYYSLFDDRLANQKPTIISTNLKEEEVLNIYGARIHSRLKQCVTLNVKGEDQRKPPKIT